MSGHSKWHNIQKTKGAADAKRSQTFTKIAREMIVAVKMGGSGDPNNNSRLATVIAKARAANMPNDNIKRTIEKALGSGNADNYENVVYEGYGPSGVGIMKDTLNPLLGEAPTEELSRYIAGKVLSYEGVLGTHDLMVHDYGPGRRFGSVHVEMDAAMDVMKSHEIIDTIERDFLENDNMHIIIHFDPIVTGDEAVGTKREWVKELVQSISPDLSIHDFRMVPGEKNTNLIFDVAAPADFAIPDDKLKQRIGELVHKGDPSCTAVVTVDKSYAPIPVDAANTKG